MRRFSWFSWLAFVSGLSASAVVVLLSFTGALNLAELRSIDWRYQHARDFAEPLNDQIALVGIDDGSFGLIGRWPWPRSVIAQAVTELDRAGARTVVLDLLLSEADRDADGDRDLAAALDGVEAVLGVSVGQSFSLGDEWATAEGELALTRLLDVLSMEVDLSPSEAAVRAAVPPACEKKFLEAPLEFKAMAAWRTIGRLSKGEDLPSLDDLMLALTSGRTNRAGADFDAVRRIDEVWGRASSWQHLRDEVDVSAPTIGGHWAHRQEPPIAILAKTADGIGIATSDVFDVDGGKRRTSVAWVTPAGTAHQLGVAAAATHLGTEPSAIDLESGTFRIGSVELPMPRAHLEIDWPTSTFDGFAGASVDQTRRPAIAIGALVSLARERVKLGRIESERDGKRRVLENSVSYFSDGRFANMEGGAFASAVEEATLTDALSGKDLAVAQSYLTAYQAAADGLLPIADASAKLHDLVDGKLVFVGWTATGALADQVHTPLDPNTPGVIVHAAVADMILGAHARPSVADWVLPVAVLSLGLVASSVAASAPTLVSTVASAILALGWAWFATRVAFNDLRVIVPLVAPAVSPVASWATSTAAVAVVALRDRARITRQFAARVSPQLVEQLARHPDALTVSGDERQITVMFGDLAGFTTIAEKLGGPGVVKTLNLYLGRLADELVQRNAYVNKFLGDGFMAFWSAFGHEPRQEALAAESAVACQRLMTELAKDAATDAPKISVRIGIATGMAVVGDCGAPPKLNDYTAIGDVVNLASRLESANKQFGTGILMDGATRQGLARIGGELQAKFRSLGKVVVVGQSVPVDLFELVGLETSDEWIGATERAVALFAAKEPAASVAAWREFETRFGTSKVSQLYIAAIEDGEGTDGVLRLRAK